MEISRSRRLSVHNTQIPVNLVTQQSEKIVSRGMAKEKAMIMRFCRRKR
jgi:hypothetical protein